MAPRTDKEPDFAKSKCTAAKLKQMYNNHLLPHGLSLGYRLGEDVPASCKGEIMMFASFFLAGLVSSFSKIFTTVISFYNICHLHLNPNSIIMLGVLAHMCKNFIRVELCLDLFRYLFTARLQTEPAIGSCEFRLHDVIVGSYLEMGLKLSWLGWREEWFYLKTENFLDNIRMSNRPA